MTALPTRVKARLRKVQLGQGMVEYALILVLVALIVVVVLLTMGNQVGNLFSDITGTVVGF